MAICDAKTSETGAEQGRRVEGSTAWLGWLVQGAGHELMLFASVGILLFGLDDILFDALWFGAGRARRDAVRGRDPVSGTVAVFVPAWREAAVLPATLTHMLRSWAGEDVRLYVGCYPNDAATLMAVAPLVARDRRVRLVIGPAAGPTTKGDNLNRMWHALGEDERAEGRRFAAVVLHDAEDRVHPAEIALYRVHLAQDAMVQIPVVPHYEPGQRWIGGHYADEFAEAHGKELALRSRLGLPLPSAGVGTALTRNALSLLAIGRGGDPFRADSLAEDYEVGMLLDAFGLSARFVDAVDDDGTRIVSRGEFPARVEAAARQKARWVVGIALAGWDHVAWPTARPDDGPRRARRAWAARWMLWRDRRAPLAAIVILAAYIGMILAGLAMAGEALFGWSAIDIGDTLRWLLAFNAVLLLWRLSMRFLFTARCYGLRAGLAAVPRAFVANLISVLAARRAIACYWTMQRSGRVIWDKTDHPAIEAPRPLLLSGAWLR